MVFDGIPYGNAPQIFPMDYHPDAPLVDRVVASVLQCGFFAARRHGQVVLQQSFPFDSFDPSSGANGGLLISAGALTEISSGYAYTGEQWTHAIVNIVFGAIPFVESLAQHRIAVNDGATTATGDTVETPIAPGDLSTVTNDVWRPDRADGLGAVYSASARVSLSTLTLGADCYFRVDGAISAGFIGSYRPFWLGVFLHAEDT